MQVQELKKLIKEQTIPNFLIFTGEEWMVQKIYINQIGKVNNLEIKYIDSIFDIWASLNSRSLLGKKYLYVLQDDRDFMTEEKIYSNIENRLHNNMLILQLTSADKRLKILKQYKDSIVEFNALNEAILKQYIQKEIALSDRNCDILMEICDYNYGHCLLEIDKIYNYYMGAIKSDDTPTLKLMPFNVDIKDVDVNKVFKTLLEDGTIHIPPRDNIWTFIKAVLKNKPLEAYELWHELKELKTPIMSIIYNLYTEAKHVYQIQTCKSDNVSKVTGLNGWQIKNARECSGYFSNDDLVYLMKLLQNVERGIKQGRIEESIAIDYILTDFL